MFSFILSLLQIATFRIAAVLIPLFNDLSSHLYIYFSLINQLVSLFSDFYFLHNCILCL